MDQQVGPDGLSQQEADPYAGFEIPAALVPSLDRHRENLTRFIVSLQALGFDERQIESSVSVIVASYKEELISAIRAMRSGS